MATPIGHYLVGLAVTEALARDPQVRAARYWIAAVACAPDLDVIPGFLLGELGRYHHHATHSLTAGVVAALGVLLVAWWRGRALSLTVPVLVFAAYVSHHVLDAVTANPGPRPGMPLLWPWSETRFLSPWALLPHVQHTSGPVVSTHNVLLALREIALLTPLVAFVRAARGAPTPRAWAYGIGFLAVVAISIASLNEF
ncbi:MAG TPA: metal-dependent hydrolase [Candidatus Tectomicrobia bacterium]|nr:metal-dependent hydrolase [Candidatus Tectomicrobia bacterium]